jgi:hypothetical protein
MPSIDINTPKSKSEEAEVPELVVSSEDKSSKETNSPNDASSNMDAPVKTEAASTETENAASISHAKEETSLESVGALIQELFQPDNTEETVKAALDALYLDLRQDTKKCDKIQAVGGCHALVQLVKNCLKKATERMGLGRCRQYNERCEFSTLHKSLGVITSLSYHHNESRAGITAIGGVEAVVKVMNVFPMCHDLQLSGSHALLNLTHDNIIGAKKAVETGGINVLLAAVNNHLDSASTAEMACLALRNMVGASEENTGLLIS